MLLPYVQSQDVCFPSKHQSFTSISQTGRIGALQGNQTITQKAPGDSLLHLIGQNWLTWPPLTVGETEKTNIQQKTLWPYCKGLRPTMIHFLGLGTLWPNKIRVLIIRVKQSGERLLENSLMVSIWDILNVCLQLVNELDPIQKKYCPCLLRKILRTIAWVVRFW